MSSAHNLQLQIQAMAVMVEVEGMKAENQTNAYYGAQPNCGKDSFEQKACELYEIMQAVSHD